MKYLFPILSLLYIGVAAANDTPYLQYVDSAAMFGRNGRWERSEEMLRKALSAEPANPGNTMLFSNLGVALSHQGKYGAALEAFDLALVKAPASEMVLTSRALTWLAINQPHEAIADLSTAIEADSLALSARRMRGQLYLTQDSISSAMIDFTFLRRHTPSDPLAIAGLAACHEAKGDVNAALPLYQEALSLETDPDERADIYTSIASCLISLDRLNEADDIVREALKEFPRYGSLYLMRGMLHARRFQFEDMEIDKKFAKEYGVDPQIVEAILPKKGK